MHITVPEAHVSVRIDLERLDHCNWLRLRHQRGESRETIALSLGVDETVLTPILKPPLSRAQRRRDLRELEKRRRKHDKFVTPQNKPEPVEPLPRPQPQPRPSPPPGEVVEINDAEVFFHDRHHEDTEDVLYKETEIYGEFNFRDTILQQLERYFVYLVRMRKKDPDAYALYRQVGAVILPYVVTGAHARGVKEDDKDEYQGHLSDWFHRTRPAFGCFVYGIDPESEKYEMTAKRKGMTMWMPKFMYYTKYEKPPPELQPMGGGDVYMLTVWWDRPQDAKLDMKYGVPEQFGIFISRDGTRMVALAVCDTRYVGIPSRKETRSRIGRRAKRRALGAFSIPQRAWHLPSGLVSWAKHNNKDPGKFLAELFIQSVQHQELTQYSMIRVSVTKDDLVAAFMVNVHRTGYFFQDRDYQIDGTRKRIFHMVRPHVRSDGTAVKTHFRGERHFTWAGYDILITVPGLHHGPIDEFKGGSIDEYWWKEETGGLVDQDVIGARMAAAIRQEPFPKLEIVKVEK
jgi:hypothetical protein